MPMCHNVTEAMAVGTIPVINYPEWLNPDLEDMVNCVAFSDPDSLVNKITQVLNMERHKINEMKNRVIKYYRDNLDTSSLVKTLEAVPNKEIALLMITDAHVANNEFKLNKNSIIITGEAMHPNNIWDGVRRTLRI